MASRFQQAVLAEVQNEEYQRAIAGLDSFVADFLHNDPLMRIDFSGLTAVLRPALVMLVNAQLNGLDVSD